MRAEGADRMTSIYDPPIGTRPGSAPQDAPPAGWPVSGGPGGPGGPYGPYGYGGGGGPSGPVRRLRRKFLILLYVVVIGLASFWGLQASQGQQPASQQAGLSNSQIAAQIDPGLVDIVTALGYQHARAAGTGMVLTPSGEVLTNNHVIEGATSIKAIDVGNGRTYRATVVGYDRSHDVAVLRLRGASGLKTVATGSSAHASAGQKIVAIGNAGGKGGTPSLVSGRIVSLGASVTATDAAAGTRERLSGLIGHNAPIKPGDSGGPLVTRAGKVIGINTAASSANGFRLQGQTQAFAVPINQALSIANRIESGRSSAKVHIGATGFVGVAVVSADQAQPQGVPAGSGVLISGVFSESPASAAGLRAGDVIVSAGGRRVGSPEALQSVLQRHHPGDHVALTWINQGGLRHSATVTLIKGPAG
jgi:S1-C subfamily serine protease